MSDRINPDSLPWSREAEQGVLGGLLLDNSAYDRIGDLLQRASFFDSRHASIFDAATGLIVGSKVADVLTVFEVLQECGKAEECGGIQYLNALTQSVPSAANSRRYAEIVAEKAAHRALMETADEALTVASEQASVADKTDRIVTMFTGLQARNLRRVPQHAGELVVSRIDQIQAIAEGEAKPGIPTHIPALTEALNGGFRPGKVYVLAARPSVGKSSLAQDLALHLAQSDHTALFLSQEMESSEVVDRALANLGHIDYSGLQRGEISDWGELARATDRLRSIPFFIDDQPALTLGDIRAKAMAVRREGLQLLVLDYLQLCAGTGRRENRNTEIEEISRGLKSLSKDMRIAILLLSQLNRDVERRASPEPTLADLRDSGAIEQDADVVMFLWRVRQFSDRQVMGLSLPKNRQGKAGARIALEFQGQFQRWGESEADIEPQRTARATTKEGFDA